MRCLLFLEFLQQTMLKMVGPKIQLASIGVDVIDCSSGGISDNPVKNACIEKN